MTANRAALDRRQLIPRHLRGVASRSLETDLLGMRLAAPVLLAPIGAIGIVHAEGELGVAAAARATGISFILSTVSSTPMESVAEAAGTVPRWFQLYWPRDPELCRSLVGRAEAAGYGAIVLTIDTMQLAWRPRDLQHGFLLIECFHLLLDLLQFRFLRFQLLNAVVLLRQLALVREIEVPQHQAAKHHTSSDEYCRQCRARIDWPPC